MAALDTGSAADDFTRDGFLVLPAVLTAPEVSELNAAIEAHRAEFPALWPDRGEGGRCQSVTALLGIPGFDRGILHPEVLPLVKALIGENVVFEEHSVMVRAPIDGDPPPTSWHRDVAHDPEHPLRLRALSVVYYLTDVDAGTHCFSAVPESVEAKAGLGAERPPCSGDGAHDLLGPAGTAVLFNAGSCHAGRLRRTDRERRTVHIYYGPGSQPPMSNHTPTPRRLVEHEDPEARRLFRRPNDLTRAMLQQA